MSSILLVQEDRADAELIRDALADSNNQIFQVNWVQHCHEAIQQLSPVGIRPPAAKHAADAILLDMFLPDSRGTATFDRSPPTYRY
jgi:CheY-like chemotaxis protein